MTFATFSKGEQLSQETIMLENNYSVQIKREKIAAVGRSIFRDIDSEQIVFEISDPSGRVTKRLGFPAGIAQQVTEFIGRRPGEK